MGPISCSYYVTTLCNAKCGFCNIWEGAAADKPKLLPTPDCQRIIAGLKKIGVKYIDFTGGEPLLEPRTLELLEYAKSLGIKTGLVSNGFVFPKYADRVAGLVDSISFSLDSADPDRHNASRGLKCYDRVMESIELARQRKMLVNINYTVSNDALDEIPGMADLAKKMKILVYVMPVFSYFGNDALREDYVQRLRELFNKPYMSVNLGALAFQEQGGNHTAKPKCKANGANVAISPDGRYYLPCFHSAIEKPLIAKDMLKQWKSPDIAGYRDRGGSYPFCEGCTVWCYIGPSFFYTPDKYFVLQAWSLARTSLKVARSR